MKFLKLILTLYYKRYRIWLAKRQFRRIDHEMTIGCMTYLCYVEENKVASNVLDVVTKEYKDVCDKLKNIY